VGLATGVNNGSPSWPNRIGPGTLETPDPARWFNDKDFVAPPPNTYGNVARGALYASGIGSPTVGRITSTIGDNRDLQFALKLEF